MQRWLGILCVLLALLPSWGMGMNAGPLRESVRLSPSPHLSPLGRGIEGEGKAGFYKRGVPCARLLSTLATTPSASLSGVMRDLPDVLLLRRYNTRLVILSTTLLGITSGLIGTFLLLRKRSLMGDALSHATLPGIAAAFMFAVAAGGEGKNLATLLTGATITGLLGMLTVLAIRNTTRLKDDAAMGIVLSVFFGIGVAMLGIIQKMPEASAAGLESFIYGKTASMVWNDFVLIACVTVVVGWACILMTKEFAIVCFDEAFASSQGWPTSFLDMVMLGLAAAVTVIGLQAVGLILIIAFLITPATAARFWTHDLQKMLLLSGFIGGVSGWLGASVSALFPGLPAGALIVLVAASIFAVSMLTGPARGVIPRYLRRARLQRKIGRQHLLRSMYELLESSRPANDLPVENLPIRFEDLLNHRSWSPRSLNHLLKIAEWEDHVESSPSTPCDCPNPDSARPRVWFAIIDSGSSISFATRTSLPATWTATRTWWNTSLAPKWCVSWKASSADTSNS